MCSLAILCGSIAVACSGTIETPTEEFPPREGGSSTATNGNNTTGSTNTPPRTPAATPSNTNNTNDDPPADDDPPAAPADDEEDPPADEPPADDPPAAAGDVSFATDVQPIFNQTCGPCHAEQGTAGVSIGDSDIDVALESAIEREEGVFRRIEAGTMPPPCGGGAPGDSGCISEEDLATIQAWYDAGSPP